VVDTNDQKFGGEALVVDPKWRHGPAPDDGTRTEPRDRAIELTTACE
jgi:hypothetical protein